MWHLSLESMNEVTRRISTVWKEWISHSNLEAV